MKPAPPLIRVLDSELYFAGLLAGPRALPLETEGRSG
jgi:hypothetical protein